MKSLFIFSILVGAIMANATNRPLIIGHRGASGYRPEHTLESYKLAIQQGADFIEPDLVITKDKVLIVRHENEISGTTDAAEKFPDLKTTKLVDGQKITGWFAEDLTLAEIKTLRAKERLPYRDHSYDFKFEIPTFAEVLALVKSENAKRKVNPLGVYPETKHPTYFRSIGLGLEERVVEELKKSGLNLGTKSNPAPIFLQSFELGALKRLNKLTHIRLIFLLDAPTAKPFDNVRDGSHATYEDLMKEEKLSEMKSYVYGLGPAKNWVIPPGDINAEPTKFISLAHKFGFKVHPYTFRSDKENLPPEYNGDASKEYLRFFHAGVDGLFSDFPDQAVKARDQFLKETKAK